MRPLALLTLLVGAVYTAAAPVVESSQVAGPQDPACYGVAKFGCLPGLQFMGIGFDAILGTSQGVGRQVVNFSFHNADANTYLDPFGNKTVYNYPDQAQVTPGSAGKSQHNVFRSVNDYVSYQSTNANAHLKVGPWFSASMQTTTADQEMRDGLHIIAESTMELGIYEITMDPSTFLKPTSKFAEYVAQLPEEYDGDAYSQLIADWGTHYISYATLGGRASMTTKVSQDYFSQHTDSDIQAQLSIQWGLFGGGGGGGSNSSKQDSQFTSNSNSETHSVGGDPAIRNFNNPQQWSKWALSVETTSPVVTTRHITMLHFMVADSTRRANVLKAINEYAAQFSNHTFPVANITTIKMNWCDCYDNEVPVGDPNNVAQVECNQPGFMIKGIGITDNSGHHGYQMIPPDFRGGSMITCCRPCFTASN